MSYGIIYKWTCAVTDMSYVGQTVSTLQHRWSGHKQQAKRGSTWEFHKAIREFGSENFVGEILCECQTAEALDQMEQVLIAEFDTTWPNGYNMRNGGQYTSDTTRQLMRFAKLGKKQSEEHKRKISNALRGCVGTWAGRTQSEESNQKRSVALVGRKKAPFTEEHRQNIVEAKQGSIPWNRFSSTTNNERIKTINEATLDRLHTHIIQMVRDGLSFEEIVKRSGKKRRTTRSAILRALKKEQIKVLPVGFYKRGPYRKNNK
jgi:group I intron endonuclease